MAKKVSKAAVGAVIKKYETVLKDEASIADRKASTAQELHDLIGSSPVVLHGEKVRAIKRTTKDEETGEETVQYFWRAQKPVDSDYVF